MRPLLTRLTLTLGTIGLCSLSALGCASDDSDVGGSGGNAGTAGAAGAAGTAGTGGTGGIGPGDTLKITTCPNPPTPVGGPGADVCSVAAGAGSSTLLSGDVLVPGEIFEGGSVVFDAAGTITCVGCDCEAPDATQIVCPEAVVSPGLINAHDHVGWMNGAPWVAADAGVDPALRWEHRHDWRRGRRGHPSINEAGGGASMDEKAYGELRFALAGSTAVFGSGDISGILRDLDRTGSGQSGLGQAGAVYNTFPLGDGSNGAQLASGCSYPDIANPPGNGVRAFVPHVSEGIDQEARNEFLCLTGQGSGSKQTLNDRGAIIHGVGLTPVDVAHMASTGIDLIWSPRSNISLYGDTAAVTLMARSGVNIGLGTDWLPSGSMNMLRELRCADDLNRNNFGGYFSDQQLWLMATLGSARALAQDNAIGVLVPGHQADIAVFANAGRRHHRAVLDATVAEVALVLRGGLPVTGNSAVVDALASGCDELGSLCGTPKRACLSRDTGKSWAALQAAVGTPSYTLEDCGTPVNEPTCLPHRSLPEDVVNGSSLYTGASAANDRDGDGIPDDQDNCPDIFNPVRPLDGGEQADFDGDSVGDVCDPCPLEANVTTCASFNPSDSDNDGVPNEQDNCPDVANADQADRDNDGKGDACDTCPDDANPGALGCPYDIATIKTTSALEGERVAVYGSVVTAVGQDGFFIQKNTTAQEDHAAVFVYVGSGAKPAISDVVDVTGATRSTFYEQVQLNSVTWVDTGANATLSPRELTSAQVTAMMSAGSATPLEGQLVTVQDVAVSDDDPPGGTGDTDNLNEFELEGGLRVDDAMWPDGTPFIDPFPSVGERFPALSGPVAFRNGYLKLLPRSSSDILFGDADVQDFGAAKVYQRVGAAGDTLPAALVLNLTRASVSGISVEVVSDDPTLATVPGSPFTIAAGESSITIPVTGVAPGVTTLTARRVGETTEVTVELQVLAADAVPAVLSVTPNPAQVLINEVRTFTVTLEHPAPAAGLALPIDVTGGIGTAPATLNVLDGEQVVTFDFTAASTAGAGTLSVDGVTTDINVLAAPLEVDLSGWQLQDIGTGGRTYTLPANTLIEAGGYLIIARNATRAEFEEKYQITLGPRVAFIGNGDIVINGSESYTLTNLASSMVDGPTLPQPASGNRNYQRLQPVADPSLAGSWLSQTATVTNATPGSGQGPGDGAGIYISEVADLGGTGNFNFEFVEIHYDGG